MNCFLEACCTSLEDALRAQEGGASRIELCEDLSCGGVSPSLELLEDVLQNVSIPVNVLVRPARKHFAPVPSISDFVPGEEESDLLVSQIESYKAAGAAGIVAGALLMDGSVDIESMKRIVETASPLPLTFHKAFDLCKGPDSALEEIISLGCKRILTSGCAPSAEEGLDCISRLIRQADGRIIIMPGGHIRKTNLRNIISASGAAEYHASAAFFD